MSEPVFLFAITLEGFMFIATPIVMLFSLFTWHVVIIPTCKFLIAPWWIPLAERYWWFPFATAPIFIIIIGGTLAAVGSLFHPFLVFLPACLTLFCSTATGIWFVASCFDKE